MVFDYLEMLSGMPLLMKNVGHVRSPKLKEVIADNVGTKRYNLYLKIMSWTKVEVLEHLRAMTSRNVDKIIQDEKIELFDIVALVPHINSLFEEAFSFFFVEQLTWNEEKRRFDVESGNVDSTDEWAITKETFETVRTAILELNFIFIQNKQTPKQYKNTHAEELWAKAQGYINKGKPQKPVKDEYDLGNIVSKLCTLHSSYNLLNVYDLTIFQVYDQFTQCRTIRATNLGDNIFANHGGEHYDTEAYLKPIIKL